MIAARAQHGFTLVEVLASAAISIVVFGSTLSVLDVFQRHNRFDVLRNENQDSARTAIDRMARELRNVAAPNIHKAGALEQAKRYSLAFDTVNPTPTSKTELGENLVNVMGVRYCLSTANPSNEILWRQTLTWKKAEAPELPSSSTCPDLANWTTAEQLVQHITNRIGGQGGTSEPSRWLFNYGPPGAKLPPEITSVEPRLFLDLNPGGKPGETQITTTIYLRNQNRQPIASFTANQVGKYEVYLNASESYDPNGLALSYKWSDNGTVLNTTAQQYQTAPLVPKSIHVFKLQVTNPGGLTSEVELPPFTVKE